MRRSVHLPFNLVCLFARTRKNVCKQREKERKRGSKHTLDDTGSVYCAPKCGGGSGWRGLLRIRCVHSIVNKPTSRLFSGSSMAGPGSPHGSKLSTATRTNVSLEYLRRHQVRPRHAIWRGWRGIENGARGDESYSCPTPCFLVLVMWPAGAGIRGKCSCGSRPAGGSKTVWREMSLGRFGLCGVRMKTTLTLMGKGEFRRLENESKRILLRSWFLFIYLFS